jgi:hypothetical protein
VRLIKKREKGAGGGNKTVPDATLKIVATIKKYWYRADLHKQPFPNF